MKRAAYPTPSLEPAPEPEPGPVKLEYDRMSTPTSKWATGTPSDASPLPSPSKLKTKKTGEPSPSSKSKAKAQRSPTSKGEGDVGIWTADKREALIEHLLSAGLRNVNIDDLARELDVSKTQVRNATQAGRKGNLRDKACKAVRGDGA